jgi:hypothetical protein
MIVLAFWGLTRSIAYTAESIRRQIFDQLPPHLVFVHTYRSSTPYKNARANESVPFLDATVSPLRPYKCIVDDLDQVKAMLNLEQYHTKPDPWNTNYETLDNFVLAMYSKYRVTKMIQESNVAFNKVIFLRPDVYYTTSILPALDAAAPRAWVIPNFQLIHGFNDRFCVASDTTYMQYGCIFPFLLGYSRKKPLHSETIYAEFAKSRHIPLVYVDFFFQRIRINGEPDPKDRQISVALRSLSGVRTAVHWPRPSISQILFQPAS